MSAKETLIEIIALDEKIAELKEQFDKCPDDAKVEVLTTHFDKLLETGFDSDEVPLALARCLDMIGGLPGDAPAEILTHGLGHQNPDVRLLSGEVLFMLADDGLAHIMPAVEIALKDGGVMAEELPFVVAEVDDPEAALIIERFLKHDNAEVVASAIEALIGIGDSEALESIRQLKGDKRTISFEEEGQKPTTTTLGQLVEDALELFDLDN